MGANTDKDTKSGKALGITGFDRWLIGLINNNLDKIAIVILVILSVLIRVKLIPETTLSPDYESYYLPWVEAYREYGFFGGLSKDIGDYYVPYNVMYAICSLFRVSPIFP